MKKLVNLKKNHKTNTKNSTQPNNVTQFYEDELFGSLKPMSEKDVYKLAKELFKWGQKNRNALLISEFCIAKGLCEKDLYALAHHHESLREAIEFARECLGSNRERGALFFKLDSDMMMKSQSLYCDDWKKTEKWRAKLNKIPKPKETVFNILMPMKSKS